MTRLPGIAGLSASLPGDAGERMHAMVRELYPVCRSITGDGVRATLAAIAGKVPLEIREVPSGTPVLDWTIPKEWNIRGAWIADASGRRIVDFEDSSLHVMSYSVPVRATMSLAELRPHLHTIPDRPDWIPYRTSYYAENWGFCLTQRTLDAMSDGTYEVVIDSTLADGHLTYGEFVVAGDREDEVLVSCHVCHPSLANDNLSGVAMTTMLAEALARHRPRLTYRFLWIPGTIGAIAWLAVNRERVGRVKAGLVVACVGDPGPLHYKRSRRGDALIDRSVRHVLERSGAPYDVRDFSPIGYDERQYGSPGFDLPVGSLTRTPNGRYPEYHSSADDLNLVRPEALAGSLATYASVMEILDGDGRYRNTCPFGEPQLGRRGLYSAVGGTKNKEIEVALLWVLNLSDGSHSLLDVAERSGLEFALVRRAADLLADKGLLEEAGPA